MKKTLHVWICPKCNRPFSHKNQEHSCVVVDEEKHFVNKNPEVKKIYDQLIREVKNFGTVFISPAENAILIKGKSTFLAVKPKKKWIDIEFILEEEIKEFPIHKTFRYTKNKFAHFMRLDQQAQVDQQLISWLKKSYEISIR